MRKNIVEVDYNNQNEVIDEVADYIGVESFIKEIEKIYRECIDEYDNSENILDYLNDSCYDGDYTHQRAWEFAIQANRDMKKYLHMNNHSMPGNFADIEDDYPAHITGTRWPSEYAGDDYFRLFHQMVARLDSAEDSEQADEDREYLAEWFFDAFGTCNIKYNFNNDIEELAYELEEEESVTA